MKCEKLCIQCVHFFLDVERTTEYTEMGCEKEWWGGNLGEFDGLKEIREQLLQAMGCDDFEIAED